MRVRVRAVGFGIARGFQGLRFRIGCARRRMSRIGCVRAFGSPWYGGVWAKVFSGDLASIIAVYSACYAGVSCLVG